MNFLRRHGKRQTATPAQTPATPVYTTAPTVIEQLERADHARTRHEASVASDRNPAPWFAGGAS